MHAQKRVAFTCWYDQREFTWLVSLDSKAKLIVVCPFCEKEAEVDLNPYRESYVEVQRGGSEVVTQPVYQFPDVPIPTRPVGEESPPAA